MFNILGLFVFHQHSHGHGHEHGQEEEGHQHVGHIRVPEEAIQDHQLDGNTPETLTDPMTPRRQKKAISVSWNTPNNLTKEDELSPSMRHRGSMSSRRSHARSRSRSHIDEMPIHPAYLRNEIISKARRGEDSEDTSEDENEQGSYADNVEAARDGKPAQAAKEPSEVSPLLGSGPRHFRVPSFRSSSRPKKLNRSSSHQHNPSNEHTTENKTRSPLLYPVDHQCHKHAQSKSKSSHGGHSHDDMNIRGIFFHVLGDALGNVGVMASALIIWLTPWSFRFYFDPAISLLITLIILKSALPLCRDTAKPLLQAVPSHISVDDIREDIETLPGVRSCHHVHVWALTPQKLIATLDVELDFDFEGKNAARYMHLAREIKSCLHGHGIHSSTIQPEFCTNAEHGHAGITPDLRVQADSGESSSSSASTTVVGEGTTLGAPSSGRNHGTAVSAFPGDATAGCGTGACLLDCHDDCKTGKQCCGPESKSGSGTATPKRQADEEGQRQKGHEHGNGGKHR